MIKKIMVCAVFLSTSHMQARLTRDCLLDMITSHHAQYIEFCFTDFLGTRKSIIRPIEYLEHDLEHGINFDGSSVKGCTRITESDMLLMPDLETPSRRIPWTYDHTNMIRIMCTMHSDANTPYAADPRALLKKEIESARQKGYDFLVGPEVEFYVFEQDANPNSLIPIDSNTYTDASQTISMENTLITILHVLNQLDLNVEKIHHEVGAGQFEISLRYASALPIADALITTKHALTALCKNYNKKITFMPKPFTGKPGSGMHLNISLFDLAQQRNAFSDQQNPEALSAVGKSFIAGIIKHFKEITLLLNPTVNSYKRLGGHEAPKFICCGTRNRSALIRIPNTENQPEATRAEIRSPDAMCNPYLAFAALLKAGMEGIENNYVLEAHVSENLYTVSDASIKEAGIKLIPQSMQEALEVFERSEFVRNLLGDTLFYAFLDHKKEELADFMNTVTDWELKRYQ